MSLLKRIQNSTSDLFYNTIVGLELNKNMFIFNDVTSKVKNPCLTYICIVKK